MRAALLLAPAVLACGPQSKQIVLPLPELGHAQTLFLAELAPDRSLSVTAYDLSREPAAIHFGPYDRSSLGALSFEALLYDEPIDHFSVMPGPLTPAPLSDPDAGPPPAPGPRMFVLEVQSHDPSASAWATEAQLSDALKAFRFPAKPTRCAHWGTPKVFSIDTISTGTFALTITPTIALLGISGRTEIGMFMFSSSATAGPVRVEFPPGLPLFAATRDSTEELWFAGSSGAVWRGHFDPRTRTVDALPIAPAPSMTTLESISVYREGGGVEIWTMGDTGAIEHWDGRSWSQPFAYPPPPSHFLAEDIAVVGRGEAIAVASTGPVMRIKDGVASVEAIPAELPGEAISAASIPGRGIAIGTTKGGIALRNGGEWTVLPSLAANFLFGLHGYPGGLVFGGAFGYFGQWTAGEGACAVNLVAGAAIHYIAPLGLDLLLFGENPNRPGTPVTFLPRDGGG